MRKILAFLLSFTLISCTTGFPINTNWKKFEISISGKLIKFSVPPGDFKDIYVPTINLETEGYTTLYSSSWDLGANEVGISFFITLSTYNIGTSKESFIKGLKNDYSNAYNKFLKNQNLSIDNINYRNIGGKEWLCFNIPKVGRDGDCVRRIDSNHYVTINFSYISDDKLPSKRAKELKLDIFNSFTVAI
jgi:hypothetical protein